MQKLKEKYLVISFNIIFNFFLSFVCAQIILFEVVSMQELLEKDVTYGVKKALRELIKFNLKFLLKTLFSPFQFSRESIVLKHLLFLDPCPSLNGLITSLVLITNKDILVWKISFRINIERLLLLV